jgi:hypothetical protein
MSGKSRDWVITFWIRSARTLIHLTFTLESIGRSSGFIGYFPSGFPMQSTTAVLLAMKQSSFGCWTAGVILNELRQN